MKLFASCVLMSNSKYELNWIVLLFHWGFTFTVGEDVKQAYLQEVLGEKGKGKKTWLVCFQSAIKQTQIINVPLKPHIQITKTGNWTLDAYYFSRKESFMKMLLFHDVRQKLSIDITQLNFLDSDTTFLSIFRAAQRTTTARPSDHILHL